VVRWQQRHTAPHRLPGERVQDRGLQEVNCQPLFVQRSIE
jgi:hypothetical protein